MLLCIQADLSRQAAARQVWLGTAPLFHYCTAASCVVFDDAIDRVHMTVSCWRVVAGASRAHRGGNSRADLVITDAPHHLLFSPGLTILAYVCTRVCMHFCRRIVMVRQIIVMLPGSSPLFYCCAANVIRAHYEAL